MDNPKWQSESYTPSPHEQCCRCGEPLGAAGAYYWGRIRICQRCHLEIEQEYDGQLREFGVLHEIMQFAGWAVLCVISAAAAAGVVTLFVN